MSGMFDMYVAVSSIALCKSVHMTQCLLILRNDKHTTRCGSDGVGCRADALEGRL